MSDVLKRTVKRIGIGLFWPAVVLVLPNCSFSVGVLGNQNLHTTYPSTDVVFCDIPKALGIRCATSLDKATGIRFTDAAIALSEGRTSNVGLDYSPAALLRCGGDPEATVFEGPFPQGYPVCFNCGVLGATSPPDYYAADKTGVCRQKCYDFYGFTNSNGTFEPDEPPTPSVKAFCDANARVSTNYPENGCYHDACTTSSVFSSSFADPRIIPESVDWTDRVGTKPIGFDLLRDIPYTGAFDAGAASRQWVTHGDAYFEFGVTRNHRIGFAELPAGCPQPCPDAEPGLGDIDFALEAGSATDPHIYVFEYGQKIPGSDFNGSVGSYFTGERFRIYLHDNGDGTARVSYWRVTGSCVPGSPCQQLSLLLTSTAAPHYPFRVDVSIQETNTGVLDGRMVFIH